MNNIGEKIRLERLAKNYSQENMAWELGISQPAYSKIERNETKITVAMIYQIAEILKVSPLKFLPAAKFGTGINHQWFLDTIRKISRVFGRKPKFVSDKDVAPTIHQSDKSNT